MEDYKDPDQEWKRNVPKLEAWKLEGIPVASNNWNQKWILDNQS